MYVIRWVGRVSRHDYLADLSGDIDVTASWRPLREAKKFDTKEEAENYLINPDNGRRYWQKEMVQVIFMHPLNMER